MSKKLNIKKLPDGIRLYLNQDRMISDHILDFMRVGYTEIAGVPWIVFPIAKDDGTVVYKLKGMPGSEVKAKNWPQGCGAQLYASGVLKKKELNQVVICEGEPDCLLLLQHDFAAVTSTAGAMTFKDEWLTKFPKQCDIILCFDDDDAGNKGREKLRALIIEKRPDCAIFDVRFERGGDKGFDVTDFWLECRAKGLDPEKEFRTLVTAFSKEDLKKRVIADIGEPEQEVSIEQWRSFITARFPTLTMTAEIVCSVVCQLIIKEIYNPFALVITDKPGSGKTITINFVKDIKGLTHISSDFSPASFVSNIAARSQAQLEQIDLLPRIRWKTLLIKDMAPILSDNDDTLRKRLGILTDVLDGEGYTTESGVYGSRGYKGDYLFMFIAASTPFPGRVWKLMVGLGHRIFFLGLGSKRKKISELLYQIKGKSFKKKEDECREMTHNMIRTIWKNTNRCVEWDQDKDEDAALMYVAQLADFIALFRGDIFVHEERWTQGETLVSTEPRIEDASRANQCLYNLCCGHAILCGRNYMTMEDLWPAVRVCFDTAPNPRPKILRELLLRNGKVNVSQLAIALRCSHRTAKKELHKLVSLDVCDGNMEKESNSDDGFEEKDHAKTVATLKKEFMWLLELVKVPCIAAAFTEALSDELDEMVSDEVPLKLRGKNGEEMPF